MKLFNKILSLVLIAVLAVGMCVTSVSAVDPTYTITVNSAKAGHTYEAYKIFDGKLDGTTLSNITWGEKVDGAALLAALQADETYGSLFTGTPENPIATAADVAKVLSDNNTNAELAKAFADLAGNNLKKKEGVNPPVNVDPDGTSGAFDSTNNKYEITGLTAGYYLVKDQDKSQDGKDDAYTDYILQVVNNVEVTPKSTTPTVEKKVQDVNDSETIDADPEGNWKDSADYDIGDFVPFKLTATLGSDKMDVFDTYEVVFTDTLSKGLTYVPEANKNDAVNNGNWSNPVVKIDGQDKTSSFTITSAADGDNTKLTISCDDVKALGATNGSVITVEYSARLNEGANIGSTGNPNKVYLEYSNNPNGSGKGKTSEDVVVVFTYKVVINKIDGSSNENPKPALAGAGFTLYKKVGTSWIAVGEEITGVTTFSFEGIDDGIYMLKETTTPATYNTMEPVAFRVSGTHSDGATEDDIKLTALSATTLTDQTDNGTAITGTIDLTAGLISGLDTPDGSLNANVENYQGSTLPSTGGMGTKLIYTLGGVLVLAALVLLVSKRRMHNN